MTPDERDKFIAKCIREGVCPFGELQSGGKVFQCSLGLTECFCNEELITNQYLSILLDTKYTTVVQLYKVLVAEYPAVASIISEDAFVKLCSGERKDNSLSSGAGAEAGTI